MRGNYPGRKFRDLKLHQDRGKHDGHWVRRRRSSLEHEGVDTADLLRSTLLVGGVISRFAVVAMRRDVRVNQRTVVCMMRVCGRRRRMHMRMRQYQQTDQHCKNGSDRPEPTHHSLYRSVSSLDCQAAGRWQL
jgi:hypothetical protein